jgi:hypothetical protein
VSKSAELCRWWCPALLRCAWCRVSVAMAPKISLTSAVRVLGIASTVLILIAVLDPSINVYVASISAGSSGWPDLFSWHPVFMTVSVMLVMTQGIVAYVSSFGRKVWASCVRVGVRASLYPLVPACVCACVRLCVRACVRVCMRACVCVRACVVVRVFACARYLRSVLRCGGPGAILHSAVVASQVDKEFPDQASRRVIHGGFQITAVALSAIGYLIAMAAHATAGASNFGGDHVPIGKKAHVWFGYISLFLIGVQVRHRAVLPVATRALRLQHAQCTGSSHRVVASAHLLGVLGADEDGRQDSRWAQQLRVARHRWHGHLHLRDRVGDHRL